MDAYLVFNELSSAVIAPDRASGVQNLNGLASVLLDARIGSRKVLVTPPMFLSMFVCSGHSVGRWLTEYSLDDHERRLRFKTLIDHRIDYEDCVPDASLGSPDIEFSYLGSVPRGLCTAFLIDGLAVSLLTADDWRVARVRIEKSWVDGNDISTVALDVAHAGQCGHLDDHLDWLKRSQTPSPTNGVQLWNQRKSLFPSIEFCASVEDQIKKLGGDGPPFRSTLRGLQDLQTYCASWTGPFDIHAFNNASGESQCTLEKYSAERTFRCPDGENRLFEWHLKRGDTRIHFREVPEHKRILVGYVGGHLRICSE
jgi:hypothetical protein